MELRLLSLLFFVSFISSLAEAQSGHCNSPAVRILQRPVFSQAPHQGTFEYRYSVSERENNEAPMVIFVPGGPGETSMDMPLAYPSEFIVVRTDPRGMGCNANSSLPATAFTSEEIARDVLAIVRDLKPKKYILHGISYGTVVVTMAAALAEKEKLPQPAAVVLEGTMAKVFKPNEYLKGYIENWRTLKQSLPHTVTSQFLGPQFPLGFSSKEWAAWAGSLLLYGEMPSGDFAASMLAYLDPSAPSFGKSVLNAQLKLAAKAPTAEKIRLYREIICRELVPDIRDVKYDFDFVNGNLVDTNARLCAGIPLSRPYDSANYQIKAPVFYFSGDKDPATPSTQVTYHFQNQYTTQRSWVSVKQGGHRALTGNLMDCSESLWRAIAANSVEDLKSGFAGCALKDQIDLREVSRLETAPAKKVEVLFRRMKSLYKAEAAREKGELLLEINWGGTLPVASAHRRPETEFKIVIDAGMLTWDRTTPDSLAMTLCHEMGHLMGGEALRHAPAEWDGPLAPNGLSLMSSEGQSDYYATAVCFRRLLAEEDHRKEIQGREVPSVILKQCDEVWGTQSNASALCQRTALASLDFLNMVKEFPISLSTPDQSVAKKTIRDEYPPRQCRLDTLVAGAFCTEKLPLNFSLQDRAARSSCAQGRGARPACWYNSAE